MLPCDHLSKDQAGDGTGPTPPNDTARAAARSSGTIAGAAPDNARRAGRLLWGDHETGKGEKEGTKGRRGGVQPLETLTGPYLPRNLLSPPLPINSGYACEGHEKRGQLPTGTPLIASVAKLSEPMKHT